jgi:hypothetical protein
MEPLRDVVRFRHMQGPPGNPPLSLVHTTPPGRSRCRAGAEKVTYVETL